MCFKLQWDYCEGDRTVRIKNQEVYIECIEALDAAGKNCTIYLCCTSKKRPWSRTTNYQNYYVYM